MKIKILSLNMWEGGLLMDNALDFIRAEQADIVALQEVYNGQDERLTVQSRTFSTLQTIGYEFSDFQTMFVMQREGTKVPIGNALLSRFRIEGASKRHFVDDTRESWEHIPENFALFPRILQIADLSIEGRRLRLINCHGVWDLDGDNLSPQRRKMVAIINETVRHDAPTIMVGDTNAQSSNPVWNELLLRPVFGADLKSTFNMRRKDNPGYAGAAVDLMFVNEGVKILSSHVPDVDVSDHLPIVAEVELASGS